MDVTSEKLADSSVQPEEDADSEEPNSRDIEKSPQDMKLTENEGFSHEKTVASDADFTKELENKTDHDYLDIHPESDGGIKVENGSEMKNEIYDTEIGDGEESGTEEDRVGFMQVLETFCRENSLDFKPPKFYGEPLNCLKLWRAVTRLGGYDRVTSMKLWRQVGETFHPPKTCTTVSWTFRIFYEKALLEYEKHKRQSGELHFPDPIPEPVITTESEATCYKTPGSGRARRDSAARAMQGWHSQRHNGYGEEKNSGSAAKREKHLKNIGVNNTASFKQKKATSLEHADKAYTQLTADVVDLGTPADWVKINVREAEDCFEVYALVPGLLREEVRVQSDPAGHLVITGQPEQLDNPWGITPFKKVVNFPARIDPLQTSAVVSLHGRLFVRVPFANSNHFGRSS